MCKAVQDPGSGAEPCHCAPVFFLVEKEAGLLSVLYVHNITDSVFRDLHPGVKGIADKTLEAGKPLFLPDLCVAPLIDTPDPDPVLCQNICERLKDQGL